MRLFALLSVVLLTACVDTVLPVTRGRIMTEDQFRATAAGKTLTGGDTSIAIRRNGTFVGVTAGTQMEGRWRFQDGFWCRSYSKPEGRPDTCEIWAIENRTLVITANQGAGPTYIYALPTPASTVQ